MLPHCNSSLNNNRRWLFADPLDALLERVRGVRAARVRAQRLDPGRVHLHRARVPHYPGVLPPQHSPPILLLRAAT